ncbi:MAG: glycosyltransferase family 2 protein [Candidatus Korobacteraceae bacterium]
MPLVSVIVNVRNGASTLREALDSVMAQAFSDWEVIVWDDCSTDGSANIVARFSDPRIHYFLSPQETSLGKARDNAIRQARGEWLAFLDQDDVWMPRKLEMQMALADQNIGIIYGRTVRFYPSGMQRDYDQAHEFKLLPEGDIFTQLFSKGCFIAMSSAVFRRSAVKELGGIPKEIQIIPDYYLYTAVSRRHLARAVQEVVCRYRMHGANTSRLAAIAMHQEALWLVDHWSDSLDPRMVALSRKRHSTAIALEELRSRSTAVQGISRLLSQGSVTSQLKRPVMFAFHIVRRNVRAPYWKAANSETFEGGPSASGAAAAARSNGVED